MPHALTDIETSAVALVKRGANRKRFAFTKGEGETSMKTEQDSFEDVLKALLSADLEDEDQIAAHLEKASTRKGARAMKAALQILDGFRDEQGVSKIANALRRLIEGGEAEAKKAKEDREKGKASKSLDDVDVPAEVRKSLDPIFKAQQEAIEKAEQRAAELSKALDAERDARLVREYVEKAEADYPNLPGAPAEKIGPLVKAIAEKAPEEMAQLAPVLKAASAALASSAMFTERGSGHTDSSGNAIGRIEAIAKGLRESDPKLSAARAFSKALDENPELYREYMAERRVN